SATESDFLSPRLSPSLSISFLYLQSLHSDLAYPAFHHHSTTTTTFGGCLWFVVRLRNEQTNEARSSSTHPASRTTISPFVDQRRTVIGHGLNG
ncbi:hypothetical protein CH063_00811, partial [Colletotrichum higginsianum]